MVTMETLPTDFYVIRIHAMAIIVNRKLGNNSNLIEPGYFPSNGGDACFVELLVLSLHPVQREPGIKASNYLSPDGYGQPLEVLQTL